MINSPVCKDEIEKTVLKYRDSVLRLAYTYLKNHAEAEDVAQDVFVAYIQKKPFCITEDKKKSWLMQVTANKCKNQLNSAWKRYNTAVTDEISYMPPENAELIRFVLSLDEKYRIPIHLYYYEGYSIREISQLLGRNFATIGTWLSRGRELLKSMIGDDIDG